MPKGPGSRRWDWLDRMRPLRGRRPGESPAQSSCTGFEIRRLRTSCPPRREAVEKFTVKESWEGERFPGPFVLVIGAEWEKKWS